MARCLGRKNSAVGELLNLGLLFLLPGVPSSRIRAPVRSATFRLFPLLFILLMPFRVFFSPLLRAFALPIPDMLQHLFSAWVTLCHSFFEFVVVAFGTFTAQFSLMLSLLHLFFRCQGSRSSCPCFSRENNRFPRCEVP